MRIAHNTDPKADLLRKVGDLSGFKLTLNWVLTAIYEIPKDAKTVGGLIVPEKTASEGAFQGKAHLVVAMGPLAFQDDENVKWGGQTLSVGDWIFARPQDGSLMEINGVKMRLFKDVSILGKLDDPDAIW